MNIRDLVREQTGLDLSEAVIDRAVGRRIAESGVADAAAYAADIAPGELRALVELLVVPESWMFRDAEAFAAAAAFVQRRLAAAPNRVVRILSVPCAGGEEPYSMAMALRDAGVAPAACSIDAIDLSEVALQRARRGRYTLNAFRGGDLEFRARYFTRTGNEYQIHDELRAQVRFSQGNLLATDLASGGRYDVVFCRNLLIYFDEPSAAAAIARLHALLADDGLLFAGYAEVPTYCRNGFATVRAANAFALQKATAAAPATPAVRAPVAPPRAARVTPRPAAPQLKPKPPRQPAPAPGPPDVGAVLAQARKQADQGDHAAAAAACKRVLDTAPDNADAYFILGLTSECGRNLAAAEGYWRRCVYLKPDHYEALCHLALLAGERGDAAQSDALRQRAARVYQRANDGAPKGRS
ncbi:methyltransferase domain-containing protein [Massilia sp. RP-1-19]|uniref:Methyltransferase domain-containing protein n=1 Tax=Massilia polaris TaxID=2728846 RepID=A0A848HSD0_9BURK|nr:CheR family methyltransferase [Massilia polaris]NML62173.1 methyltransferase domain-containing protein [Massilia polaris]